MAKPTIDPQVWTPPPADVGEATGTLGPLELLRMPGAGPEDVVLDADGRLYTGLSDGRILRFDGWGAQPRQLTNTGGRPLGIEVLDDEHLLVCDADRGLLRVPMAGGPAELLLDHLGSRRLVLTNNAAVAPDGVIFFSESSSRWPLRDFRADLIEHSRTGSLLRFDPANGDIDVLLDGLAFANGVTLTAEAREVLIAETAGYAIHRVVVDGPRAGEAGVLAANLGGFPDNLSTGADGTIWCALPSPRNPAVDALLPRPPAIRKAVWALPEALQPDAIRTATVLGFSADDGRLIQDLRGDGRDFHYVTGVREHDGWLYLGSLVERAIARAPVPTTAPSAP